MFSDAFRAWLRNPVDRCLLVEVGVKSGGSEITHYLSTTGYNCPGDVSAGAVVYHGWISGGCAPERQLDLSGGGGSLTFDVVEIDNVKHDKDSWLDDIWDGRPIAYFLGANTWARADFVQVFAGTTSTIEAKDRNTLALHVHDILALLADTFSTALVGGAADNASALMPYTLGECMLQRPILIDDATQKYSTNNGDTEDYIEALDNCVPVLFSKQLSAGTFTLTAGRFGEITCHTQGAKVGGAYRNDVGGLIEWVATSLGDGNKLVSGDFDAGLLSAFRAACPQPIGRYVTERINRLALMQELAATVGATVTTTGTGKVQIVRLGFGSPTHTITAFNMEDGSFGPVATPAVQGAQRLAWGRNWSPGGKNIAGSVSASQIPILTDEYNYSESKDATVLANYKQNATPIAVETLFIVKSDADAEALRRRLLWDRQRIVFGCRTFGEAIEIEIGETITIIHPFSLEAGAIGQVIGVKLDLIACRARLEVLVGIYWLGTAVLGSYAATNDPTLNPEGVDYDATRNQAWMSDYNSGYLRVLDLNGTPAVSSIASGFPGQVYVNTLNDWLVVNSTVASGEISRMPLSTRIPTSHLGADAIIACAKDADYYVTYTPGPSVRHRVLSTNAINASGGSSNIINNRGACHYSADVFYVIDADGLHKIDSTGFSLLDASIGTDAQGLAVDRARGLLYTVRTVSGTPYLYKIDPITLSQTQLSPTGLAHSYTRLRYDAVTDSIALGVSNYCEVRLASSGELVPAGVQNISGMMSNTNFDYYAGTIYAAGSSPTNPSGEFEVIQFAEA
jgi:hypothetical protein